MTSQSFIYSHRRVYHWLMRGLYGRYFEDRYRAIAAEIPPSIQVVDVCAGDAYLYLAYLRYKSVSYVAVDASAQLVAWARAHGVAARQLDVWTADVPCGDIVIMQASLYQFLPHADRLVERLLAAARQRVIITEPIRNVTDSKHRLVALLGQRLTHPSGEHYTAQRFNRESFMALCRTFPELLSLSDLPGSREMMAILRGRATEHI